MKKCKYCKQPFDPKRKEQIYCSRKCSSSVNIKKAYTKITGVKKKPLSKMTKDKISKSKTGVSIWGGKRDVPWMIGDKNHKWKKEDVDYHDIHSWVTRWKGNIKECEMCGIKNSTKRYHWANIDHKYRRVLDDYIRLCPKCHYIYDKRNGLRK